jgi:hypothetical protein
MNNGWWFRATSDKLDEDLPVTTSIFFRSPPHLSSALTVYVKISICACKIFPKIYHLAAECPHTVKGLKSHPVPQHIFAKPATKTFESFNHPQESPPFVFIQALCVSCQRLSFSSPFSILEFK